MSKADDYNRRQSIAIEHITELTRIAQRSLGLDVDGMFGPKTRAAVESLMIGPCPSPLAERTLQYAIGEIGQGETVENNVGSRIDVYRGFTGSKGNWCASFVSWCMLRAFGEFDKTDLLTATVEWSARRHVAKRLYQIAAALGRSIDHSSEQPIRGDIVCWHRGPPGSWQGHVGIVEHSRAGLTTTIEGNHTPFPCDVGRKTYNFAQLSQRLVGIARLF